MIPVTGKVYGEDEKAAIQEWLNSGEEIPYGSYYKEFEKALAEYVGVKHAYFVNSGSSANLVAFAAFTSPDMHERWQVKAGDEIITLAASFPTTVAPIVQYGCVPVFLDIDIPTYNIRVADLEKAITKKTKGVFIAHTLGNPFNIDAVVAFCKKYNLFLIEDTADAFGSLYKGKKCGSFGTVSTTSFYPAHDMSCGGGGAVFTDDPIIGKIIFSMTHWGKKCVCECNQDGVCNNRFGQQHGNLPYGYDHKYVFSNFGYNVMATNIQAALGLVQLAKMNQFTEQRHENFKFLYLKIMQSYWVHKVILPQEYPLTNPSWFMFPILCENNHIRDSLAKHLNRNGIATRLLFAGNILKQPCFVNNKGVKFVSIGDLENTDKIMNNLLLVGCWHGLKEADMQDIFNQLDIYFGGQNDYP